MKKIPIGLSDFKTLIEENYYYVDKTSLIKELIDRGSMITLLPRPRRFGKTLNMSMLRYFFQKSEEDNSHLFKGLYIDNCGQQYKNEQGRYPVVYLTFKDVKELEWESTYGKLQNIIIEEFSRHAYVKQILNHVESEYFKRIEQKTAKQHEYESSIYELSKYLFRYHKEKVIILIDEYDTPMNAGHVNQYTKEITDFIRGLMSFSLKDNTNLHKGIITGILRISKESIFSDMNNLEVCTIIDEPYSDKFGFSEMEVEQFIKDYGLSQRAEEMKKWYNGYIFGNTVIYNPWSMINFIQNKGKIDTYWINTSSNEVIKTLFKDAPEGLKKEMEQLIKGETIRKEITPNITFEMIERSEQSLWTFFLFSGYLKHENEERAEGARIFDLKIPNKEVLYIYRNVVMKWFEENASNQKMQEMLKYLLEGDVETFGYMFKDLIEKSISYFDPTGNEPEMFYHAFVLGMLIHLNNKYEIKSNRESGYGRYDVMVIPRDYKKGRRAIIMEFKKVNKRTRENLEVALKKALQQIKDKKYEAELEDRGIASEDIIKLAIAFDRKEVELVEG